MTSRHALFAALVLLLPSLFILLAPDRTAAQQLTNAFPNLSFQKPLFLTHAGDGTDRIFVVEQGGLVKVFPNDSLTASAETFLDLSGLISSSNGEQGLLGLAFHPEYEANGYFFVNYTAPNPLRTVVARYTVDAGDPNRGDPGSAFAIIEIAQPYTNHNGGMLAFGPDGYLYIGMGDGGSAGDPENRAQNLTSLLGKILRIDVNDTTETTHYVVPPDNPYVGAGGLVREEIWAYGFRNPWRFSFDSATGDLWAGDVGQNDVEEIDIVRPGRNYGWRIMEGTHCYNPSSGCDTTGLTPPIKEYLHPIGESITGGYVYHGARRSDIAGSYIYGDFVTGRIWMLRREGGLVTADSLLLTIPQFISSFGVDQSQELHVVTYSGSGSSDIYRFTGSIAPAALAAVLIQYPNPFTERTLITYQPGRTAFVSLRIFDAAGRIVRTLVNGKRPAGSHDVIWDGTDSSGEALPSGVYLCRLVIGDKSYSKKIVLVR